MRGPVWTRLAAATGLLFAVAIAATGIVGESKDIALAQDYASASNEVFGSVVMLIGVAAALLFWFSATLSARLRQLDPGSPRLAAAVNGSGAFIAGALGLAVGVLFAARNYGGADLAPLASGILDGPTLMFPAAVYVGAAGLVGVRTDGLPTLSRVVSRLSLGLAAYFVAAAGLQIFQNYAWINETSYIAFIAWVALLSGIGISRWTDLDERHLAPAAPAPVRRAPVVEIEQEDEEEREEAPPPRRRPAARKPAVRKPAARKKPAPRKR
jgi:hypothetical protein